MSVREFLSLAMVCRSRELVLASWEDPVTVAASPDEVSLFDGVLGALTVGRNLAFEGGFLAADETGFDGASDLCLTGGFL